MRKVQRPPFESRRVGVVEGKRHECCINLPLQTDIRLNVTHEKGSIIAIDLRPHSRSYRGRGGPYEWLYVHLDSATGQIVEIEHDLSDDWKQEMVIFLTMHPDWDCEPDIRKSRRTDWGGAESFSGRDDSTWTEEVLSELEYDELIPKLYQALRESAQALLNRMDKQNVEAEKDDQITSKLPAGFREVANFHPIRLLDGHRMQLEQCISKVEAARFTVCEMETEKRSKGNCRWTQADVRKIENEIRSLEARARELLHSFDACRLIIDPIVSNAGNVRLRIGPASESETPTTADMIPVLGEDAPTPPTVAAPSKFEELPSAVDEIVQRQNEIEGLKKQIAAGKKQLRESEMQIEGLEEKLSELRALELGRLLIQELKAKYSKLGKQWTFVTSYWGSKSNNMFDLKDDEGRLWMTMPVIDYPENEDDPFFESFHGDHHGGIQFEDHGTSVSIARVVAGDDSTEVEPDDEGEDVDGADTEVPRQATHQRYLAEGDYAVRLDSFGNRKIELIRLVRSFTGLGVQESVDFVSSMPVVLRDKISKEAALDLMKQIGEIGGTATLISPISTNPLPILAEEQSTTDEVPQAPPPSRARGRGREQGGLKTARGRWRCSSGLPWGNTHPGQSRPSSDL